jgi:tRNA nucleotidyltransferase/poly(A) polymerase
LREALLDAGFQVADSFPLVYRPHTTVAYLMGQDTVYEGDVPSGDCLLESVEIWGLPKLQSLSFSVSRKTASDETERRDRLRAAERFPDNLLPNLHKVVPESYLRQVPYIAGQREILIYRSVPPGVTGIRPGDWVTLTRSYARVHGRGKILTKKVPVHHVYWAGTDMNEWFYTPVATTKLGMTHQRSVALMKFLSSVAQRLGVAEHVYVVGGAVRNWVIKEPIKDIDVVIDPIAVKRDDASDWFAKAVAKAIPVETSFVTNNYGVAILTIKGDWLLAGESMAGEVIEIANARKESYGGEAGKGYKPHMTAPATIQEDIVRREFTFNSLLWRMLDLANGPERAEIIDLTGCGLKDLQEGVARCPRDPDVVFTDDPSRMIRGVKFFLKYGLKLSPDVASSIRKNRAKLKNVPGSHLSNLLIGTFFETGIGKAALLEMDKLGLLDVIRDIAREDKSFQQALAHWADKKADLKFVFDLMDLGMPVGRRIGFLSDAQKTRLREITVQMGADEADAFVAVLEQPGKVLDFPGLISEFGLKGPEIRQLMDTARNVLLADPELTHAPALWEAQIRSTRGGTRTAGILEPPPVMMASVLQWMLSVYAGHVLAQVEEKIATQRDTLGAAKKALADMQHQLQHLEQQVGALGFGEVLRVPIYSLRVDGTLRVVYVGTRVSTKWIRKPNGALHFIDGKLEDGEFQYEYGKGNKRLTFTDGGNWESQHSITSRLTNTLVSAVLGFQRQVRLKELEKIAPENSDSSLVELYQMRKECLKYTSKAKAYHSTASRVFPVDVTGWKYITSGSPAIQDYNEQVQKYNDRLKNLVQKSKEELELAQRYAKVFQEWYRTKVAPPELKELAKQMGHMTYRNENYWYVYRVEDVVTKGGFPDVPYVWIAPFKSRKEPSWVPADEVVFADTLGPEDLDQVLKGRGWDHITCSLNFVSHHTRGGIWFWYKRELEVDAPTVRPRNLAALQDAFATILGVLTHEMKHVGQDLLRIIQMLQEDAGLPPRKVRRPNFDPEGHPRNRNLKPNRLDHALRDVEFYPRVGDEVLDFLQAASRVSKSEQRELAKNWVTVRSSFFVQLRKKDPAKWRKAVNEFVKEIQTSGIYMSKVASVVQYVGVFLTPMSQQKLLRRYGQSHPMLWAHHMTLWHLREEGTVPDLQWGETVGLKVTGHYEDEKVQVVTVQPPSGLTRPGQLEHVTISTNGVNPEYANRFLEYQTLSPTSGHPSLQGYVGWVDATGRVHTSSPKAVRLASSYVAKTFSLNVGDPVLYGKFKNKPGKIKEFGEDAKSGDPTVVIEPDPKGRKEDKELKLFKIRYDEGRSLEKSSCYRSAGVREWFAKVIGSLKKVKDKFLAGMRHEYHDTKQLARTMQDLVTGHPITEEQRREAKQQVFDVLKLVLLGSLQVVPIPGVTMTVPLITRAINQVFHKNYQWLPSGFRQAGGDPAAFVFDALIQELARLLTEQTKTASAVSVDVKKYQQQFGDKLRDLVDATLDRQDRARREPPNWDEMVAGVREFLGPAVARKMDPASDKWVSDVLIALSKTRQGALDDPDLFDRLYALSRSIMNFEESLTPAQSFQDAWKEAQRQSEGTIQTTFKNAKNLSDKIGDAIRRIPTWGDSIVVISPHLGEDWLDPVTSFSVRVGHGNADFTVFLSDSGRIEDIGDQLEAGDTEFFRSPADSADYFNLLKELLHPGSSAKGKRRVLYTARPTKDRKMYERTNQIPVGVFLTTNPDDAVGLAVDLGGSEKRDVWRVVMDDSHLVMTLDSGSTKHFQVVGRRPAPVQDMSLIMEGGDFP